MTRKALPAAFAACALLAVPAVAQIAGSDPHAGHMQPAPSALERIELDIPDVTVLDEEGKPRLFYSDLVKGRVVAVNFLFTNCTTVCPPLGVTFAKLRKLLGERAGRDFHLISVSVDPSNDTPARLKAWAQKFGFGPGWHLVTGERAEMVRLLKALGAYTANPNDHPPLVLIGNDAESRWTRAYGLSPPARLAELLEQIAQAPEVERTSEASSAPEPSPPSPLPLLQAHPPRARGATAHPKPLISKASLPLSRGGRDWGTGRGGRGVRAQAAPAAPAADPSLAYFGDTVLVDQDGRPQRLYTDLMKGRTVLIHVGFTRCTSICPMATASLKKIQARLGDRLGRDVHILSISIDPAHDTPALLKEYAKGLEARPGWHFLTGKPEEVEAVLRKLGLWAAAPEKHPALLVFGNLRTGLWKKVHALADSGDVLAVAESVFDDPGAEP